MLASYTYAESVVPRFYAATLLVRGDGESSLLLTLSGVHCYERFMCLMNFRHFESDAGQVRQVIASGEDGHFPQEVGILELVPQPIRFEQISFCCQ